MLFHDSRRALRVVTLTITAIALSLVTCVVTFSQGNKSQTSSGLSNVQRMDVMRSKLDAMRRSLENAISGINAKDASDKTKNPEDPRERLRALVKEVGSVLGEVNDLHAKEDRSEKYDVSKLDTLEASVADLNTRVEAALQSTAAARTAGDQVSSSYQPKPQKGKRRLFGLLPGKSSDKYTELTGSVAPGRDRVLFLEATREVRKNSHDTGRLLFTTIITTYPDSVYLPLAKLAIADSFYLEGTTSALIQAGQAYQDWLTFFPTDPLADAAMMKVAETEMRQMGLSDRDITHARKAEQRLKALLQQYPQTRLRPEVLERLRQVQDNLAMHNLQIARFYYDARYKGKKGGLKGAQDRLKEIVEKYPNFCLMDEVLFRFGTTFQEEEEPDQAAKFYQQLVRDYPNSEYVDKAKEQLNIIGAAIPEPDPIKKSLPQCEKPSFMQNMMQQVTGSANVGTSRDGILITKHGEGTDLIDKAIANNGQLPEGVQPVIQRDAPNKNKTAPSQSNPTTATPDSTATRPRSIQSPTPGGLTDELSRRHRTATMFVIGFLALDFVLFVCAYLAAGRIFLTSDPSIIMALWIAILVFGLGAFVLRRTRFNAMRLKDIAALRGTSGLLKTLQDTTIQLAFIGGAIAVMGFVWALLTRDWTNMLRAAGVSVIVLIYGYPFRSAWERVVQQLSTE